LNTACRAGQERAGVYDRKRDIQRRIIFLSNYLLKSHHICEGFILQNIFGLPGLGLKK